MKFGKHQISHARVSDPLYIQFLIEFGNDYGASIVSFTQGNHWEVAVIRYTEDGQYTLDYTTPVTDETIRDLSDVEVGRILDRIQALPRKD